MGNTTLDYSCEKDSILLNKDEILSVFLNGTFLDSNSKAPTQFTPPDISYSK